MPSMKYNDMTKALEPDVETSSLKAGDVCKILDKCRQTGVKSLEFLGLRVEFGFSESEREIHTGPVPACKARLKDFSENEEEATKEASIQNSDRALDETLSFLDVLDPVAFEELSDKLADKGIGNDENSETE